MKKPWKWTQLPQCRPACESSSQNRRLALAAGCAILLTLIPAYLLQTMQPFAASQRAGAKTPASAGEGTAGDSYRAHRDLIYVPDSKNPRQALDLFLPRTVNKPAPLIVFIHGGGWAEGDKSYNPALSFVSRGYAVASINYRLTDEARWPEQIYDCKAAIRWLRANAGQYQIDPERIGVWGMSAGGHLAALLGTTGDTRELEGGLGNTDVSSKVQAAVDWFGPTDFVLYGNDSHRANSYADAVLERFFNGPLKEHQKEAQAASPVTYVSSAAPPFLIMHGDHDELVPLSQSEVLQRRLKQFGAPAELVVVEGAGHQEFSKQYFELVLAFFNRHLRSLKS